MVTFIISHESTFLSYIIALGLKEYYRNKFRSLKIIIIENAGPNNSFMKNYMNHDFQPWCGVNTFNNFHFHNNNFITNNLLFQYFLQSFQEFGIFPLNSVKIVNKESATYSMDKPISGQNSHINASISLSGVLGFIYHPILISNKLRNVFYNQSDISIVTLRNGYTTYDISKQVQMNHPNQDTILLNYNSGKAYDADKNSAYLINSNLKHVNFVNTKANLSSKPPSSVLWLPEFRSRFNMPHPSLILNVDFQRSQILFDIVDENQANSTFKCVSDLDMLHGLKLCDVSITLINDFINKGKINLGTARF